MKSTPEAFRKLGLGKEVRLSVDVGEQVIQDDKALRLRCQGCQHVVAQEACAASDEDRAECLRGTC